MQEPSDPKERLFKSNNTRQAKGVWQSATDYRKKRKRKNEMASLSRKINRHK